MYDFAAAMRRAGRSTRAGKLKDATRIIQAALAGPGLGGRHLPAPDPAASRQTQTAARPSGVLELEAQEIRRTTRSHSDERSAPDAGGRVGDSPARAGPSAFARAQRLRRPLGEVVEALRRNPMGGDALGSLPGITLPGARRSSSPPLPDGARYLARSFTCAAGTRGYKLYIPASAGERPRGLVVMLHGCKQDPDDFATGTRMNEVGELHGLAVAYPAQTRAYNASSCWNWFDRAHQERDLGEPAIVAGIAREIASEFGLDRQCVFVAGLSAGGAMAVVMGETYPDLYAAVGVHSGLAYGSANDVVSAFAAMRGEVGVGRAGAARSGANFTAVRTIVFQGSADRTVHPSNSHRIVAAAKTGGASHTETQHGRAAGGRTYTRTIVTGPDGSPQLEHWRMDGAGHAWSGGNPDGSYTDPQGPDASLEMARFFLNAPTPDKTA
ncbi:MAG TPA: PHB depolymerase family esterase [Gemmatimonadales bacterium]|nr:PHB depolymerase family esterase [Gemmatimonadales bacterium]